MKMLARTGPSKIVAYLRQLFFTSLLLLFVAVMLYVLINSPA